MIYLMSESSNLMMIFIFLKTKLKNYKGDYQLYFHKASKIMIQLLPNLKFYKASKYSTLGLLFKIKLRKNN